MFKAQIQTMDNKWHDCFTWSSHLRFTESYATREEAEYAVGTLYSAEHKDCTRVIEAETKKQQTHARTRGQNDE